MGLGKLYGWLASLEETLQRRQITQKAMLMVETSKENVISGGQLGGTDVGPKPWSIAGREAVMVVLVLWLELGW